MFFKRTNSTFFWLFVNVGSLLITSTCLDYLVLCRRWMPRTWRATSRASWPCRMGGSSTAVSWRLSCVGNPWCDSSLVANHFFSLPVEPCPAPALLTQPFPAAWQHKPGACAKHTPLSCSSYPQCPWHDNLWMNDKCTVSTPQLPFSPHPALNSETLPGPVKYPKNRLTRLTVDSHFAISGVPGLQLWPKAPHSAELTFWLYWPP